MPPSKRSSSSHSSRSSGSSLRSFGSSSRSGSSSSPSSSRSSSSSSSRSGPSSRSSTSHSSSYSGCSRSSSSGRSGPSPHSSTSHSSSGSSGFFGHSGPSPHSSTSHSSSFSSGSSYGGSSSYSSDHGYSSYSNHSYGGSSHGGGSVPHHNPGPGAEFQGNTGIEPAFPENHPCFHTDPVFQGLLHQYWYIPSAFIKDGVQYEPGYYDEKGNQYRNLVMEDDDGNKTWYLTCEYCGCLSEYNKDSKPELVCSRCGAPLKVQKLARDHLRKSEKTADPAGSVEAEEQEKQAKILERKMTRRNRIIFVLLMLLLAIVLVGIITIRDSARNKNGYGTAYSTTYKKYSGGTLPLRKSGNYYIISYRSEPDKELVWDKSAESYYESESRCWVSYNQDVSPAIWQYWYEDISSDYGDYGWMEYEDGKWYIEVSDGKWEEYTGDTSNLWYIKN